MKDTNQAGESLRLHIHAFKINSLGLVAQRNDGEYSQAEYIEESAELAENLLSSIQAIIRTEKLKLLAELDKSMPTAEQLTTKYGYHMPEKQYGYKLALHDIREVLAKMEAEL